MKKLFFLASALAVLASCSNNEDLPAEKPEALRIDLLSMNYEGVMTLLSEQTSLKDVTFTDGDLTRRVGELAASDNIDPDQAELLVFNAVNPADSLDMSVTPDYVSVCMNRNGERIAYLTYADANRQNEIVSLYEQVAPATTRNGGSAVTRGADGGSFKVNLTEIAMAMEKKYEAEGTYELPEKELKYEAPSAATRGWFSNLFKKVSQALSPAKPAVPKTPIIDIYLLREKGSNPVTHEMNWQVNDAISALKDVQGNVKFNVHIANCDFRGSNDADATLSGFNKWRKNSSYRNTNGVFVLCRWGGWKSYLGMAYMGDYNVNNDLQGTMISATNAWNKFTMAHEMGHIFGADHVSTKWYQVFWSADLMSSSSYDWLNSGKHKDSANRNVIKKNLTMN